MFLKEAHAYLHKIYNTAITVSITPAVALFPREQGLLQRDLSLVNFGFMWHFQFKYSFVISGIVCMYRRN